MSRGLATDKGTRHSYLPFYEVIMNKYKDEPLTLVEIGVERGGSLILWSKYFKNARIIGIDVKIQRMAANRARGRNIEIWCTNAYSLECVKQLPMIDILIDDGPHTLDSQLFCIKHYLPKIKPNGLFIIEDIQTTEYYNKLLENTPDNVIPKIVDLRYVKGQYDDLLYVIDLALTQL
jgi:cephalosporin hydroxylase